VVLNCHRQVPAFQEPLKLRTIVGSAIAYKADDVLLTGIKAVIYPYPGTRHLMIAFNYMPVIFHDKLHLFFHAMLHSLSLVASCRLTYRAIYV